jgi:(2Fe-2S) ferredoxin
VEGRPEPLYYGRHVFYCTNTRAPDHPRGCCTAKDSEELRNYMKAKAKRLGIENVRIHAAGGLDRCELGPTRVIYPEGVWYHAASRADVDEILQTHLIEGRCVARLLLTPDQVPPGD